MFFFIETLFCQVFKKIEVKNINSQNFEVTQVFYESKDKTKVPMYLVHKKVKIYYFEGLTQ